MGNMDRKRKWGESEKAVEGGRAFGTTSKLKMMCWVLCVRVQLTY